MEILQADQKRQAGYLVDYRGLEWNEKGLKLHKSRSAVVAACFSQVRHKIYISYKLLEKL